jgi:hypothetical protein
MLQPRDQRVVHLPELGYYFGQRLGFVLRLQRGVDVCLAGVRQKLWINAQPFGLGLAIQEAQHHAAPGGQMRQVVLHRPAAVGTRLGQRGLVQLGDQALQLGARGADVADDFGGRFRT